MLRTPINKQGSKSTCLKQSAQNSPNSYIGYEQWYASTPSKQMCFELGKKLAKEPYLNRYRRYGFDRHIYAVNDSD